MRAKFGCPARGCAQGETCLARQCVGLGAIGRVVASRKVVAGQGRRDLVGLERFEEPCGRQVAGLAVLSCQRVVRDLSDQGLDERVLAAFRAARVHLVGEQLAPDQAAHPGLEGGRVDPGNGRQPGRREALAEHGRIEDEAAVGRIKAVET